MEVNELRIGNWIFCNKSYINKPVRVTGINIVDRRDNQTGIYEQFIYLNEHDLLKNDEFNEKWIDYKQGVLNLNDVSPIPLTEEWLVKFGFELQIGNHILENHWGHLIRWHDSIIITDDISNHSKGLTVKIEYVHQLQNLYFALTGEELEYNG